MLWDWFRTKKNLAKCSLKSLMKKFLCHERKYEESGADEEWSVCAELQDECAERGYFVYIHSSPLSYLRGLCALTLSKARAL